jgi:hypothetical protein
MTVDNVTAALRNYLLWITHFPGDYKGAAAIAGDYLDTPAEVDEFARRLRAMLAKQEG